MPPEPSRKVREVGMMNRRSRRSTYSSSPCSSARVSLQCDLHARDLPPASGFSSECQLNRDSCYFTLRKIIPTPSLAPRTGKLTPPLPSAPSPGDNRAAQWMAHCTLGDAVTRSMRIAGENADCAVIARGEHLWSFRKADQCSERR
jgi:hypothetical protein